jgi:hypothetical protein
MVMCRRRRPAAITVLQIDARLTAQFPAMQGIAGRKTASQPHS